MDNAWGVLRCVIDLCMKQPDGKYLILRDPNKVMYYIFACLVSYLYLISSTKTEYQVLNE